MASIIFLAAVFFILAAIVGTLATGLVRILGLGLLALFAAVVVNMASSGRLPSISFSNPFSPSAQQIPSSTETSPTSTENFDTAQPNSSNGGALDSSGGDAGGTAANSNSDTLNTAPAGSGGNSNGTGTTNTTGGTAIAPQTTNPQATNPQTTTSQPASSRQGVPALW